MPKAYVFSRFGGPETESFADVPRPVPGAGQLLVAVRAAGVNPVDWKRRTGYVQANAPAVVLPAVFGGEVSGLVERIGDGVEGFEVGDAVFGYPLTGGYTQYTLLPAVSTAHKPAGVSWADAATLPVAAATAYDGLRQLDLPAGATLLVNGVGGGVGSAAAQIAAHHGLRVVGTASAAKREFAESLGVVHVESGPGVADRVRAAAPDGVDALFDLVGAPSLEDLAALLTDPSKVISGADKDTVAKLGGAPVARKRTADVLDAVAQLVAEGALNPFVTRIFPFEQAGQALRTVEDGHTRGKVVIEVSS